MRGTETTASGWATEVVEGGALNVMSEDVLMINNIKN